MEYPHVLKTHCSLLHSLFALLLWRRGLLWASHWFPLISPFIVCFVLFSYYCYAHERSCWQYTESFDSLLGSSPWYSSLNAYFLSVTHPMNIFLSNDKIFSNQHEFSFCHRRPIVILTFFSLKIMFWKFVIWEKSPIKTKHSEITLTRSLKENWRRFKLVSYPEHRGTGGYSGLSYREFESPGTRRKGKKVFVGFFNSYNLNLTQIWCEKEVKRIWNTKFLQKITTWRKCFGLPCIVLICHVLTDVVLRGSSYQEQNIWKLT